jgi:hypothetical protein
LKKELEAAPAWMPSCIDYHGGTLIGRTAIGRTTIDVLQMNPPYLVAIREVLTAAGVFPLALVP